MNDDYDVLVFALCVAAAAALSYYGNHLLLVLNS